jgi:proton glutamate symport protein
MKWLWRSLRRISLTRWILISMILGALIGWWRPELGISLKPLSTIFLRMIKSIVVPIIFGSLVIGIAGHGDDMKRVGRLALKSIIYFELITTIALMVGLAVVNLTRPGVGVQLTASATQGQELAHNTISFSSFLEHIVPQSFFEAAANNEVLQIVFFSIIFAVALSQVREGPKLAMLGFCEGLAETMFKFTGIVMKYAPIGVGAAIAFTVGQSGLGVLLSLGKLVLTLYLALIVFVLVALVPAALIAGVPIGQFIQMVKEPALIAFATTSSEAALPKGMENMERLGVPRRIVAFVIPTGYSFNLDGSTLYLAVAAIFVAQAAGAHLTLGYQLVMLLTLMITSKGVAGVPRSSLVILAGTLSHFQLPLEGVAVILGVDTLMDMGRTTINLVGNCLASVVMARWEGEFVPATTEKLEGGEAGSYASSTRVSTPLQEASRVRPPRNSK